MLSPFECKTGRGTGNQRQMETGHYRIMLFGHGKLSHLSIVESNRNAKPEADCLNTWE
jgi:hypothetical protein